MSNCGTFINPLTLWTITTTTNEFHDTVETPVESGIVWAEIEPQGGSETVKDEQTTNIVKHIIKCRYQSTIKNNSFFTLGARTFTIDAILNTQNRSRELVIHASEELPQ